MRTDDVRRLTKDTPAILNGHQCLLHPQGNEVYLLSNLIQLEGGSCGDFLQYKSKYLYSFWLVDKDDGYCDSRYYKICQQLIAYSLGGL